MDTTSLQDQFSLHELTKNEIFSIIGGAAAGEGTLADEIGYAIGKAARWIKDLGDDDEWFG